jgi:isoleucyl-tRNA synthetase
MTAASLHRTIGPASRIGRVMDDNGKKGKLPTAGHRKLIETNALFARGRLKHSYPHSWRSKKPVIFRNTPQWFVRMDSRWTCGRRRSHAARDGAEGDRRHHASYPAAGQNRIRAMVEGRPDWCISRQRAWGVPIAVFVDNEEWRACWSIPP